jgi:mannose-1-phosphate guanylyltransferase
LAGFRAVIPAGGAGTRLWPLSRAGRPKFLLDLTGQGRTLLQQTWDRLAPLTGEDGLLVVTGRPHAAAVAAQLPALPAANLVAEPAPRDSMAAIGLAAALLARREGDVVVGSFAADHVIEGQADFDQAVTQAVEAARAGYITTIGIDPAGPSTAFGYIEAGDPLGLPAAPDAHRVAAFVEKPDAATAAQYLATGRYRWNAGMFVFRAEVLLGHLEQLHPDLHRGLREVAAAWDTPGAADAIERLWGGLTKIAIDHAIAEPVAAAGGVATVPGRFTWDDVGDFASLAGLLPKAAADAAQLLEPDGPRDAPVLAIDARDPLVVRTTGRAVAVVGLDDAVVVDMGDAVLVTTRAHAQQVKAAADRLRQAGLAAWL